MELKKRKKRPFFANEIANAFRNIKLHSEELSTFIELFSGEEELSRLDVKKNQIIFGRRGTGKSHFLKAFDQKINNKKGNSISIYISLLDVVSGTPENVDNYEHEAKSRYISNNFYKKFLNKFVEVLVSEGLKVNASSSKNDIKAEAILEEIIKEIVSGTEEVTYTRKEVLEERKKEKENKWGISGGISLKNLFLKLGLSNNKKRQSIEKESMEKHISYQTDISKLRNRIDEFLKVKGIDLLYVCIDEWSELDKSCNTTIQSHFAQKLKINFFKSQRISVKIASIWTLTEMNNKSLASRFFGGIEIGQDIFKEIDLDTVFFNSYDSIYRFLSTLIYKRFIFNLNGKSKEFLRSNSPKELLIEEIFENRTNFKTLVAASHGVPRDFLELFNRCLLKIDRNISDYAINKEIVFEVAIEYYKNEKRNLISGNDIIINFVEKIDNYLEKRLERFFLLPNQSVKDSPEINELVDKKFIHQLPSSLVKRDIRNTYKVFLIDYGSFWEWLSFKKMQYDIKPISPILELSNEYISEIDNFILDISDLPSSYLFCEQCYKFFSPSHPVFSGYNICPNCAGTSIKNLKDANLQ